MGILALRGMWPSVLLFLIPRTPAPLLRTPKMATLSINATSRGRRDTLLEFSLVTRNTRNLIDLDIRNLMFALDILAQHSPTHHFLTVINLHDMAILFGAYFKKTKPLTFDLPAPANTASSSSISSCSSSVEKFSPDDPCSYLAAALPPNPIQEYQHPHHSYPVQTSPDQYDPSPGC
ncbi:DNA-dependent ATPase protein rad54 [Mucor velutinosus]|uniref:DNA-dependent ATPase protein rad54 n=1 Tax=Mucor velutinosus TaxID=708070 RepID=A0AAN7DPA5_9FUNG|nr:DNA-dependent ATPase protein rad54 [Mucor velutinosus]